MKDEWPAIVFINHHSDGGGWEEYLREKVWWVQGVEHNNFRLKGMITGRIVTNLSTEWVIDQDRRLVIPIYRDQLVVKRMVRIWTGSQG